VGTLPQRVAFRYAALQAAREITSHPGRIRTAGADGVRRELTAEVLAAFADAVEVRPGHRVAVNLSRRMKQLWDMFQQAPGKWEQFKAMLNVKATSWIGVARELPGKIKRMFADGKKWLEKAGSTLVSKIPLLRLYLDVGKLPGVGDWMKSALSYLPEPIQKAVSAITARANSLASWIDQLLKKHRVLAATGTAVSAALFAYIWFNVTEISWDVPEILRGFLGGYSFVELLHSLPESGLGLLLGLMFPGIPGGLVWNAILPITVALRIAYMVQRDYIEWAPGKELVLRWDKMGIEPPGNIASRVKI